MKSQQKKQAKPARIKDLEKVADQKSDNVRGGALNTYISKATGEKQGGLKGGS